jgi:hypothetical protein
MIINWKSIVKNRVGCDAYCSSLAQCADTKRARQAALLTVNYQRPIINYSVSHPFTSCKSVSDKLPVAIFRRSRLMM